MLTPHTINCQNVFSIAKAILFLRMPIFVISTSQISPFFKNRPGLWRAPTPDGVPVMTAVPAGIVVPGNEIGSLANDFRPRKRKGATKKEVLPSVRTHLGS
jgi:hypothetical protein